ncbi:hypothetical protein ACIQV3_28570 [Streptomyces sp. NPDC099050]|uniref:hypothetical protein n=1 Tax=Streptomyces sp. NPDC099050 TaxID=3366100 RepID=UPI00380DABEC
MLTLVLIGVSMLVRPAVPGFAAVALLASVLVSGCSGGSAEPKDRKSPPPAAAELAYYRCLESNGVLLEKRDDDQLRVDKDKFDEAVNAAASEKCAPLLPGKESVPPPTAEQLAKVKKFSACIRGKGFPDYPDPNPATGQVELTQDQHSKFGTMTFKVTAENCSSDASGGIAGG